MLTINFTLKELIDIKAELYFISGALTNQTSHIYDSLDYLTETVDEKIETILDRANEVKEDNF